MLYFYIYPKMLLPRVQILKSDVVLQLADIENIFLFYFMIWIYIIHKFFLDVFNKIFTNFMI